MANIIINDQYLDNEIMTLLVKEKFFRGDIGTFCYKEVIKNFVASKVNR